MSLTQVTTDINQLQKQRFGYMAVSLTNYDNDNEPQIAQGSKLEIGGALYEAEANESITGWGGIGASNTVYIKVVAATATVEFTTDAPTWSTSKQGYYGTGGAVLDRYIAGLYKDAGGDYTYKKMLTLTPSPDAGRVASFIMKEQTSWLWCDGSTISKAANPEYTNLVGLLKQEAGADAAHPYYDANADQATLPDLRGAVVRGVDATANRDKDGIRKSGNYQADEIKNHVHTVTTRSGTGVDAPGQGAGGLQDFSTNSTGAVENTVKNIALYYLIKY